MFLVTDSPSVRSVLTYLGGSGRDEMLDSTGRCIAGRTWSRDFQVQIGVLFPRNPPFDAVMDGPSDGFYLCEEDDGLTGTFVGGSGDDAVIEIGETSGPELLVGWTESPDFDLGAAPGHDATWNGGRDAWVARHDRPTGTFASATFLGGAGDDEPMVLERAEALHLVAGVTASADFPLHRPVQPSLAGGTDGFVALVDADCRLHHATYWGGSGEDAVAGGGGGPGGTVVLAGTTTLPDLALVRPLQSSLLGASDAFALKLNGLSTPPRVEWSTYLGGPGEDVVQAASTTVDPPCIMIGGVTSGGAFPTMRAIQPLPGGSSDAFLARVCETDVLAQRDPAVQLVEVLERLVRIEEGLAGLDLDALTESLSRIEGCCGSAQAKLDGLLDFADDATARLDAIEALLARLEAAQRDELLREIEESLFERRCLAWLWLPEAAGHLALARAHLERRLDEAVATGDRHVNEHVARARLRSADQAIAAGELQEGCRRMTEAYHALTMP